MNDEGPIRPTATDIEDGLLASTGYLLVQMGRESRRRWVRMLSGHGLTPHQFGILMALSGGETLSQRRLAGIIDLDPRNAVAAFDGLERQGFIERRTDREDRRIRKVALTDEGRGLTARLAEAGQAIEAELLAPLDGVERDRLRALLVKLYRPGASL